MPQSVRIGPQFCAANSQLSTLLHHVPRIDVDGPNHALGHFQITGRLRAPRSRSRSPSTDCN